MSHPLYLLVPLSVGLSLIFIIATITYQRHFGPLCKYPGPKLASVSRVPYLYHTIKGDSRSWIQRLHTKYGDVVRIAPDELSYATGDGWKDIYGHVKQGQKAATKDTRFYGPSAIDGGTEIIRANDGDHSRFRRNFSNAFSERALREQEPLIKTYVNQLVAKLNSSVSQDPMRKIDMVKMYNFTTFDIMGDLTFGDPLGLLEGSEYNLWVAAVFSAVKFSVVTRLTRYYPFISNLRDTFTTRLVKEKRKTHLMYCFQRVDARIKKKQPRPDIWGLVLNQKNEDRKLSLEEMYGNSHIFMVAGTETTASLLSGLTYLLLSNHTKMEKLTTEIRGAFGADEDINMAKLASLEYLQACLEEGLRMYPPVPAGLPRIVPPEGRIICGEMVPGKTAVSVHHWSTYRNPKNFKFPDSFIPERWTADTEFVTDDKACLQPFSFGPRNCLGKNLAYHEMRLILAKILWHFDLSLCEESSNWSDQKSYSIWEKRPLVIRLTPRSTKA